MSKQRGIVLGAVVALLVACGGEPYPQDLKPIPEPDLAEAQASMREQLQSSKAAVDEARQRNAPAAELAQAYGELGLLYLTYAYFDAARVSADNARQLAPEDPRWPYVASYIAQQEGRLEEAAAGYEQVLKLSPSDLPALVRLGRTRLDLGQAEIAGQVFARAAKIDGDAPVVLEGLGRVAAESGDPAAAVGYFERALELQPTATSLYQPLGLAHRALGQLEEARSALEKSGEAVVLFEDPVLVGLATLGRSSQLLIARGAQAYTEGRYADAASFYRQALELDPESFDLRKGIAYSLERMGDLDGAVAELDRALAQGSSDDAEKARLERAHIHRLRGGLRAVQGRDRAAIDAFTKALQLAPGLVDTRIQLADAYGRSGRFQQAMEQLQQLIGKLPERVDLQLKKATTQINLGQTDEALRTFRTAIELDPELALSRYRYAEALTYLGRNAEGQREREQALQLASGAERAELLTAEGRGRLRQGDHAGAAELFRQALSADPENTESRYQLATVLGHLGRLDEALTEFRTVLDNTPRHGQARRGECTVLLLTGRAAEARSRMERGLALQPGESHLMHGLARLLAAAPDAQLRDSRRSLELASQLTVQGKDPRAGHPERQQTLAMAYAADGRHGEAAALQTRVLADLDRRGVATGLARARLQAYQAGQAWSARTPEELLNALLAG